MSNVTMNINALVARLALALTAAVSAAPAGAHGDDASAAGFDLNQALHEARKATTRYTDLQAALAAGYTKFPDLHGDCVDQPGQGGMGIHYVNPTWVGDAELDPLRPEFLVYRQDRNGKHELVALEYVVFAPYWDAQHAQPPVLFGHPMHLVRAPNRYGTPMPFYELHVWAWEHNPNGLFNDWNPTFGCKQPTP